jgi:hypothetical protein
VSTPSADARSLHRLHDADFRRDIARWFHSGHDHRPLFFAEYIRHATPLTAGHLGQHGDSSLALILADCSLSVAYVQKTGQNTPLDAIAHLLTL